MVLLMLNHRGREIEELLKDFTTCYASQMQQQLERGTKVEEVKVDSLIVIMKELEANGLVSAFIYFKQKTSHVMILRKLALCMQLKTRCYRKKRKTHLLILIEALFT